MGVGNKSVAVSSSGKKSTSRLQIRIKIKLLLPLEQLSTYLLMPGILEHIIDQPNNEKDRDDCEK